MSQPDYLIEETPQPGTVDPNHAWNRPPSLTYFGGDLRPAVNGETPGALNALRFEGLGAAGSDQADRFVDVARARGVVPPVVLQPAAPPTVERFTALQQWEGTVLAADGLSFTARLVDATQEGPPEETTFDVEEVAPGDRDLVVNGAVFYWSIGYYDSAGGQRLRTSTLRFRRLPVWSEEELADAKRRAAETAEFLNWR